MILSRQVQAGLIVALLNCEQVEVNPDDLTEPWLDYYLWIERCDEDETSEERWSDFLQFFRGHKSGHEESCSLLMDISEEGLEHYRPIGEVLPELPDLKWLWPHWIPRGLLTLLVSDPGVGKSYFALDLALRIIQGSEYPDKESVGRPGRVLYVEAEHAPQLLKKRLRGWTEADLEQLFLMLPGSDRIMIDLNRDDDRDRLLDMIYYVRPDLIIIDSYGAVSLKSENAKEEVQGLLSFLTRAAMDYDCGLVMIHHPRKRSATQIALPSIPMTIHSVRGSSYLVQIARMVLGLDWVQTGPTIDRNGPRRLEVIKSNLDLYPEPLGVFFEPRADDPEVAQLSYGDAPEPYRKATKIELCMAWLLAVLEEDGPISPGTLIEWADDEGYSRSTVQRARQRLGDEIVDTEDSPQSPKNQWALAEYGDDDDGE